MWWAESIEYGDIRAVITPGGISVVGQGWDYTSRDIKPPKRKPGKKKLKELADAVVQEYREFMSAATVSVGDLDD